jgi:anthranilate phosphoribosyltransferase
MMDAQAVLNALLEKRDLEHAQMLELMRGVMGGAFTAAQIAGILIALRAKGETVEELAAAAQVMRELSTKVKVRDVAGLVDTCGTGGDAAKTFNISTASALVAAAAGAKVAKHGGRSVSSACGSADVLEALGVGLSLNAERIVRCIEEVGVGFMFAPNHHGAMKHAAPARKELGVRTLFNLLGPLTNPAGAARQLLGVYDPTLVVKLAEVLRRLGSRHALVVSGSDGLDEITFNGPTCVAELKEGAITQYQLHPVDYGIKASSLEAIRVTGLDEAKAMLLSVLDNQAGPARDIVLLNAGAALYVSGQAASIEEGVVSARDALSRGWARKKLDELVNFTRQID